jgi:hypothetical protein
MWQGLCGLPWSPQSLLREVQQSQALGWHSKLHPQKRAGAAGCSKRPPDMLRLAGPKGMWSHKPFGTTPMFRLWKTQPWGPRMPSSTDSLTRLPPTWSGHGQSSYQISACRTNTPALSKVFYTVLTWEFLISGAPIPPLITLPLNPSLMYILALSIVSLQQADTSAHSHVANWSQPWARFRLLPCPWSQRLRNWADIEQSTIFPTHMTHPPMPHPSTHTSTPTISPAHGAPLPLLPCSSHAYPLARKPLSAMWQRPTEQYPLSHRSGQGLLSASKRMTSLRSMFAITSASRLLEGCMGCWLMLGPTSSEDLGWACSQNGSTIIYFFIFLGCIFLATTPSVPSGSMRFKHLGAADRRAADFGTGGKPCPAAPRRSLMRTAVRDSSTWSVFPHASQLTGISPMLTRTLTSYQRVLASDGKLPSRCPLCHGFP